MENSGAWWGAGVWIVVTLAFLVGAILLAVKGVRRPNRR
jgi:hypothetical protein